MDKKKRRRSIEDDPITESEERGEVGTSSTDHPSGLPPALSILQPELQDLIQKFCLQKPMSMIEMKKLLVLLIAEFNSYVPALKQHSKTVERAEQLEEANRSLTDDKRALLKE